MSRAIVARVVLLFIPVFFAWAFLSPRVIAPWVVGANELWVSAFYGQYVPEVVRKEDQTWKIDTNLFLAAEKFPNNSFQPQIRLGGPAVVELGDFSNLTLAFPLYWLLVLCFRPRILLLLKGTGWLMLLILPIAALDIYYQTTKAVLGVDGVEMLRVWDEGYVFIPNLPSEIVLKVLKPIQDASFYLFVLGAPLLLRVLLSKEDWAAYDEASPTLAPGAAMQTTAN